MKNLRCYAKISIGNLLHNFECIRDVLPDGCSIIPVIKANAYSHGSVEFARALRDRTDSFAVAEMGEALTLRENGIKNGILIFGYTDPAFATVLADNNVTQTVMSYEYAEALSKRLGGLTLGVHVKLDTGMHRFGFDADDRTTVESIVRLSQLPGIRVEGIFSHFAESDDLSSDYTGVQLEKFNRTVTELEKRGVHPEVKHIANSAAILSHPEAALSAVRPGIILYGAYPSEEVKKKYLEAHPDMPLREVMTLCARVGQVLKIKKGETIGYCRTHTFDRDSVVATVTAGYADGIPRSLSNKAKVTINDEAFKIVGNVCMDLLMVDITDAVTDVKAGDEVTFWGDSGISVDEYARLAGTISYELYTGISPRVTRIYD